MCVIRSISGDRGRDLLQNFGNHLLRLHSTDPLVGQEQDSVGKDGDGQSLDIIWQHKRPTSHRSSSSSGLQQPERSTGTCSSNRTSTSPSSFNQRNDIAGDRLTDMDHLHQLLELNNLLRSENLIQSQALGLAFCPLQDQEDFILGRRIANPGPNQEAIHLGFGQWIRAFRFDRVLGSNHHEWLRQWTRLAIHRDLSFFHGL
jgi:hypothetical protein